MTFWVHSDQLRAPAEEQCEEQLADLTVFSSAKIRKLLETGICKENHVNR